MPTRGDRQTFRNEDLVLRVTPILGGRKFSLVTVPVAILLWGFAVRFNDFGVFHRAVGWVN